MAWTVTSIRDGGGGVTTESDVYVRKLRAAIIETLVRLDRPIGDDPWGYINSIAWAVHPLKEALGPVQGIR